MDQENLNEPKKKRGRKPKAEVTALVSSGVVADMKGGQMSVVNEHRIEKIDNVRLAFNYDKGNLVVTVKFDCVLKSGEIGRLAEMVSSKAVYAIIGSNQLKLPENKDAKPISFIKPDEKETAAKKTGTDGKPAMPIAQDNGRKSADDLALTEPEKVKVLEEV